MERRSLKRIQVPGAKVRLKRSTGLNIFNVMNKTSALINISKSGLSFEIDEEFQYGDSIEIHLSFPDGRRFNLKGRIRWHKNLIPNLSRIGIQFYPFGNSRRYNSIKALEYLRNMDGQRIEKIKKESEEETTIQ
ncbi:MAG: PilZ domain-containing protein [Calditrichaceae bacterium]|jgi:hypothetical protein